MHTSVEDWDYLLDCPRSGELQLEGERWRFRVHGAGVKFTSAGGVLIDVHRGITRAELIDAWRFMQYLESTTPESNVHLTEAAVDAELRKLEETGLLKRVENEGTYRLVA